MEPKLIDEGLAAKIEIARNDPDRYSPTCFIDIGDINCQLKDLGILEKLAHKMIRHGWYWCENEKCHRDSHQHQENEVCDYSYSGKCSQCGEVVLQRTKEYSLFKWQKILCYQCSLFGHATELFPGEPSTELSRMRGIAVHYIAQGLNDEEVMAAVNQNLITRAGAGAGAGAGAAFNPLS